MNEKSEERDEILKDMKLPYGVKTAKGTFCNMILVDDETIQVPFKLAWLRWLANMLEHTIKQMKEFDDFPEEKEYQTILHNLRKAESILEMHEIDLKQGRRKKVE